jgi:hypothetical protein
MPPSITYNSCPEDCGGSILYKGIISRTLNGVEQNGYLKFWLDMLKEMVSVQRVLVAFQSLSTIKKGTSQFNFQSN